MGTWVKSRVSSEQNVSRKSAKNMKIFVRISETFSRNFAFFRENKLSENEAKFREFFSRENAKCENFVKTMSVIAATINCSKELVKFSALIPQYLKFYYVILIISLPLL